MLKTLAEKQRASFDKFFRKLQNSGWRVTFKGKGQRGNPNSLQKQIRDIFLTQCQKEWTEEIISEIEKLEIDAMGDGREIEEVAKKFGVPDSVAAIRMLDLKKDQLLKQLNEYMEGK